MLQVLQTWQASGDAELLSQPGPPVMSCRDANLLNWLRSGEFSLCVDFEFSGHSTVAVDAADHIWCARLTSGRLRWSGRYGDTAVPRCDGSVKSGYVVRQSRDRKHRHGAQPAQAGSRACRWTNTWVTGWHSSKVLRGLPWRTCFDFQTHPDAPGPYLTSTDAPQSKQKIRHGAATVPKWIDGPGVFAGKHGSIRTESWKSSGLKVCSSA